MTKQRMPQAQAGRQKKKHNPGTLLTCPRFMQTRAALGLGGAYGCSSYRKILKIKHPNF
jgi:hypothetical protein